MFYRLCSLGIDAMTDCFIVFASGAKQSPGRVAKNYVILNVVKNPTDELTVHIFLTKVVGYFACAQYDVRSPIGTSCLNYSAQ